MNSTILTNSPYQSIDKILLPIQELSLIHIAALFDSLECFVTLQRKGFEINTRSSNGYLPIHYACCLGSIEVTTYILTTTDTLSKAEISIFFYDL